MHDIKLAYLGTFEITPKSYSLERDFDIKKALDEGVIVTLSVETHGGEGILLYRWRYWVGDEEFKGALTVELGTATFDWWNIPNSYEIERALQKHLEKYLDIEDGVEVYRYRKAGTELGRRVVVEETDEIA